jgi:hypothetical protein
MEKPVLLVKYKERLRPEQSDALQKRLGEKLPRFTVLVFVGDVEFQLLTDKQEIIKLLDIGPEDLKDILKSNDPQ